MWIARNEDGTLILFQNKPQRYKSLITQAFHCRFWETIYSKEPKYEMWLNDSDFPEFSNLKWEDEPIEVDLIARYKLQSLRAIK